MTFRCLILGAAFGLLSLVGCAPAEQAAPETPVRQVQRYTIDQFLDTTSHNGSSFSPDNASILVSSDESGILNAYRMPINGDAAEALTQSTTESVRVWSYFPTDQRFIYLSDAGGNERFHVFVREVDGSDRDLTPGDSLRGLPLRWAWDLESIFVATNERDSRYMDVYEIELNDYSRQMVYQNEEGFDFDDISPDGRWIALSKANTTADSDIYLLNRSTGVMEHITAHEGTASHSTQGFSPDGKSLYLLSDEGNEFSYLVKMDLASGERTRVVEADWDVSFANLSDSGRYMVVGINNDARTELRLYETATMERKALPELGGAEVSSLTISRDDTKMAFYASSSKTPRDLYVADLGSKEAPRRLTTSLSSAIDSEDLVAGEVVRFPSFDGVQIPGVLYKPHEASPGDLVPALVWVHGGPGGQSRLGYSGLIQYLVNHGYAVYAINNRGSSGYGKTFHQMDDRKHGQGDLDDCVTSKVMLTETGWVDGSKIGIIGGSYGGYMTLAALTFRPEEFAVGVDLFGISNWTRTLTSIPDWWASFRDALEQEMGDFDDTEYLDGISPLFHAEKIRRPLMVLQGAQDPRVLQAESDTIVEAVKANGVPVEYVLFPDEGHGFVKKENQETAYKAILEFLDKYLKGEGDAELQSSGV